MVSVKKIVMVTLVAVTMLGLGGLFPMQRLQNWTKFKVGAVFWLELQAIINDELFKSGDRKI